MKPLSVNVVRAHEDWTAGHVSPSPASKYDIWVASSKITPVKNAILEIRFISIQTGQDTVPSQRHIVTVKPNCTTVVCQDIRIENPGSLDDAFVIFAKLLVDDRVITRHTDWPQPYKYLSFAEDRGLEVKLTDSYQQLHISSLRPVKGLVFNERPGLTFSDNGIDVIPGETYCVDVKGLEENEFPEYMFLGIHDGQANT
jgi:beta-mannosidase